MSNPPLVSIALAAYNAEPFISRTIQSILDQTYPYWELIVVDDGSTDNTREVVQQFTTDPRVKLHPIAHTGMLSKVRDEGLRQAQGDYICFFDSDDLYEPHAFEKLVGHLESHPDCTAIYGFFKHIDEYDSPLLNEHGFDINGYQQLQADGSYSVPADYGHCWDNILLQKTCHQIQGLMMRRSTVEKIANIEEGLFFHEYHILHCEDFILHIKLFLNHFEGVHYLNDVVFKYRMHTNSVTNNPKKHRSVLQSVPRFLNWAFSHPQVLENIRLSESEIRANLYHYHCWRTYRRGEKHLTIDSALAALQDPRVRWRDFKHYCLPLMLRSVLPESLYHTLKAHIYEKIVRFNRSIQPISP